MGEFAGTARGMAANHTPGRRAPAPRCKTPLERAPFADGNMGRIRGAEATGISFLLCPVAPPALLASCFVMHGWGMARRRVPSSVVIARLDRAIHAAPWRLLRRRTAAAPSWRGSPGHPPIESEDRRRVMTERVSRAAAPSRRPARRRNKPACRRSGASRGRRRGGTRARGRDVPPSPAARRRDQAANAWAASAAGVRAGARRGFRGG